MSVNYKAMRVRMDESGAGACTADLQSQTPPLVGFHVIGKCPRCTDSTHDLFPVEYLAGQDAAAPPSAPVAAVRALIRTGVLSRTAAKRVSQPSGAGATEHTEVALQRCRCIENHAGANGNYGCGATWLIAATFSLSNTGQPVTFAAVSAEDAFKEWEGAASRAQSAASALATVQGAAAKWQTALTAILGLVAVLTVIGGRSTLQGLTTGTTDLTKTPDQIMFSSNGVTKAYPVSEITQVTVGSC